MMMNTTSALLAAVILIAAGLYQLTPLKQACLRHCRSPIQFLSQHWRKGKGGAFVMGLHHGAFCLGCCWGLMVLLFFGGVMNLYWIVGLAVVVLIEKLSPFGRIFGYVTGTLLILWGVSFLYQAFV
jgi:predicted metal-binding membrane protein